MPPFHLGAAPAHGRLRWPWAWLCALVCSLPVGAPAQPASEFELKAQILVRALLFVQWPAAALPAGQALVLCVGDEHPLADALSRQDGQPVNGHRLQVRRMAADAQRVCHAVVVGNTAAVGPATPRRAGLLRVGDVPGGLREGVMLNVQVELGRVVFDINLAAAREDGLDFDTRLLRLARYVQRD